MREIKFRAYRKFDEGGGMTFPFTLGNLQDKEQFDFEDGTYLCWNEFGLENKDTRLMQYTGLKDKNGVEIYEGDIMMSENGNRMQVKLYEDYLGIQMINLDSDSDDSKISHGAVIGNIYENPELLET